MNLVYQTPGVTTNITDGGFADVADIGFPLGYAHVGEPNLRSMSGDSGGTFVEAQHYLPFNRNGKHKKRLVKRVKAKIVFLQKLSPSN